MSTELRMSCFVAACLLLFSSTVAAQSYTTVDVGQRAVFKCETSTLRYPYEVSWERADGTFLVRGTRLIFNHVRLSDAGLYVCRIRNTQNNQAVTSRLRLKVRRANSGRARIQIQAVPWERLAMGGLLFRTCTVTDGNRDDTWTYQWRYSDGRTVLSSILYVPNLQQVHFGQYRCTARSNTGKVLESEFTFNPNTL